MKFKDYLKECGDGMKIPSIQISKEQIDFSKEETRDEINDNLYRGLEPHFLNPYIAWVRASKLLALYGIALPRIIFDDLMDGEEVVAISQFGNVVGEYPNGHIEMEPKDSEYYFYFSYGMSEDGHYDCYAVITDSDGLDELVSDETEHLDPEGETQPPQE